MGVLDQASRYAAQAEPEAVIGRVCLAIGSPLRFRTWVDTRTTPQPGRRDRTADRVAEVVVESAPELPWLLVFEFQAQHDPEKLEVTLAEAGQLRLETRHGEDRRGRYNILVALVYLRGSCPESVLDMTLPGGWGTRHAPVVWNVAADRASEALDSMAAGMTTWGILFWVPQMSGGADPAVLIRWRVLAAGVENARIRADLVRVALVFAEYAGRKEWNMFESQLVMEWTADARREAVLTTRRDDLLMTLKERFPTPIPGEIGDLINSQTSIDLLRDWFQAALRAPSLEDFVAVLKQ